MGSKVVLIVEDNADNRTIFSAILHYRGYEVLEAEDGLTGLHMAREHKPNLLLLDIHLPRMNGWEVAAALRGEDDTATIPIVAVTAHSADEARRMARRAGLQGFLGKPIAPRVLADTVERVIGPPAAA